MEATPTKIIDYLSGFKQNLVPLFQRPYTWGDQQWRLLWDDLFSFYNRRAEDTATHFMGAVVTMPARSVPIGVSKFLVIDGQQRLTTVTLLLCAIRDSLVSTEEPVKRRIQNHYLTNEGYDGLDFFKLLPTEGDRVAYSLLVKDSASATTDSQLTKAYSFFRRRLRDLDEEGNLLDAKQVLEIVVSRLMVVMINLSDADDPYLIFESLNFKGSPLEQADLVRNYFLMRFPVDEQQAVYDKLWLPMQERLGPRLTDFMRHFLGSEGDEVRKGDVYAGIKRLVAGLEPKLLRLLITRMEHLSVLYSRIVTPTLEPNGEIQELLTRFDRLDFGTAHPLLLSLYEDYDDAQFSTEEFIAVLKILDSYIVRRVVVGVPSNSLSGFFIALCKIKPIGEKPSAWLSNVLTRERTTRRWPTDSEFGESWLNGPIYNSKRACPVLLQRLEKQFGHHETVDFGAASVEHVMPQTLTGEWEADLGPDAIEIQAKWLHTIGNLTLTGYNPELSNRSYVEKRKLFAISHFDLNKYFGSVEKWDASEIQKRAESLFAFAQDIWPRPPLEGPQEPEQLANGPANFHADCVAAVQVSLGVTLSKLSRTRYESGDQQTHLVCAVSTGHNGKSGAPYFWFALHLSQLTYLESAVTGLLCLGCGSPERTLLIPVSDLKPLLKHMSLSSSQDRHYWHVVVQQKDGRLVLRLLGGTDGPDLNAFLVHNAALAAS